VAKGTTAGFFGTKKPPAVLKHALLSGYVAPLVGMVGSTSVNGRVVLLDGYAGAGRYADGSAGSPELAMQKAQSLAPSRVLDCVFVEKDGKSFRNLDALAQQYRASGVSCEAIHGDVQTHLPYVVNKAMGVPLFMFLDPCGVALPYADLVSVLTGPRADAWPQTELLLNFSDKAVRHIGGSLTSEAGDKYGVARLDAAIGPWWQQAYLNARTATHDVEPGVQAVVDGFVARLGRDAGMEVVSVPVRTKPGLLPIYHLVFATRSNYGLWVFGDSLAKAQKEWRAAQYAEEPDDPAEAGMLFGAHELLNDREEALKVQATAAIKDNLLCLIGQSARFKLVDRVRDIYGDWYGIARETWVRDAVKQLHKAGLTPSNGEGKQIRDLFVERP
jgi:three-Cys-motif partner protein